jgi:hypothetical protein
MNFQITQAALDALAVTPGLRPTLYRLGSGTGYTPVPGDIAIHGGLIYQGSLTTQDVVSGNIIRQSVVLPYDLGPFDFGEVGLYTESGMLFALGVCDVLMHKTVNSDTTKANSIRFDAYLSSVGSMYNMWLDVAETSNAFQMAVLDSVDQLPMAANSVPAAYIIRGRNLADSFRAYTDGYGLWNFDEYVVTPTPSTVVSADMNSITLPISDYYGYTSVTSDGDLIVEFITGACYSTPRIVHQAVISGANITLIYKTPLQVSPQPGDQFLIFKRRTGTQYVLPIASSTILGGVKIGSGITISADGTISAAGGGGGGSDYTLPAATTSVLGGVIVGAGLAVQLNGLINVKAATSAQIGGVKAGTSMTIAGDGTIDYNLPKATAVVLGGIKVGTGLTVAADGTLSAVATTNPYDMPIGYIGAMPANNALMARVMFARQVQFPNNFTGSVASAATAATGTVVLSVRKNGTEVAQVTFSAGQATGAVTGASVTFNAGDVLTLYTTQTIADATLANMSVTLTGTRLS